jgi:hypothetical protein
MTSARQACETLLREALDGVGSDNITIVMGRAMAYEPPTPTRTASGEVTDPRGGPTHPLQTVGFTAVVSP